MPIWGSGCLRLRLIDIINDRLRVNILEVEIENDEFIISRRLYQVVCIFMNRIEASTFQKEGAIENPLKDITYTPPSPIH